MQSQHGTKRKGERESLDVRKSPRTDVFCSLSGAGRKDTRTQIKDEVAHNFRNSGSNILPAPSQDSLKVMKTRPIHYFPKNTESSDDEIQMTGWRHAPTFPSIAESNSRLRDLWSLPSTKPKTREEPIVISSDDEKDVLPHKIPQLSLKRERSGSPRHSSRNVDIGTKASNTGVDDLQPPRKRVKRLKPPENDTKLNPILILDSSDEGPACKDEELDEESDSDYENLHGGYHMEWLTSAPDLNQSDSGDDVDHIGAAVARLSLNRVNMNVFPNSRWPVSQRGLGQSWARSFVYKGPPSTFPSSRFRPKGPLQATYSGGRSRTGLFKHRPLLIQTPLTRLRRRPGFRMADACQSICQSGGKVLVASATPGGTMTDEESGSSEFIIDPYNAQETLAIWTEEQSHTWIPAHYVNSNDPGGVGGPFRRKFYDVLCAQFDPDNSTIFSSTGFDGTLTVWKFVPPEDWAELHHPTSSRANGLHEDPLSRYVPVKRWGKETYIGRSCLDVVYRPRSNGTGKTMFAAPCQDGEVFIHSYTETMEQVSQFAASSTRIVDHVHHTIGATVWGCGSSSSDLFVCSESDPEDDTLAFHGAIDFETGKPSYHFDDHRSGEDLALDPEGSNLALFTADAGKLHLRLYDVRRRGKWARAAIGLPSESSQLPKGVSPEVRTVAWSPDGVLLAVGKNDDAVHIYDARWLRGPILSMAHDTISSQYGITVLSWTTEIGYRTPNLGLLTGGGDHCIALWDVKTACNTRTVLAELDGQVGVGSFGDFSNGEKPLVAADIDGHVYIYDFVSKQNDM